MPMDPGKAALKSSIPSDQLKSPGHPLEIPPENLKRDGSYICQSIINVASIRVLDYDGD